MSVKVQRHYADYVLWTVLEKVPSKAKKPHPCHGTQTYSRDTALYRVSEE